jgi:hypothetical protein
VVKTKFSVPLADALGAKFVIDMPGLSGLAGPLYIPFMGIRKTTSLNPPGNGIATQ